VVSLFSGVGGFDKGFEDAGCEIVCQVENERFCQAVLKTRWPNVRRWSDIKTFSASLLGCPAKTFPSPVSAPGSKGSALASFTSLRESCESFDPLGLSSRMFPDFSVATVDETLRKSSAFSWSSAGMGFAGVCSTRSFSESPKDAVGCSLSEVLESHVPQRFFLTPRAAKGILRRAEKRGRKLPVHLEAALTALAGEARTIPTSPSRSAAATEPIATSPDGDGKMTSIPPTVCAKTLAESDKGTTPLLSPQRSTPNTARKPIAQMEAKTSSPKPCPQNGQREVPGQREMSTTILSPRHYPDADACKLTETETISSLYPSPDIADGAERTARPTSQEHLTPVTEETNSTGTALMSVRRLTPTECEVLQGLPRGWTIPHSSLYRNRLTRRGTEPSETLSPSKSRNGLPEESCGSS
jgi:hypothetical protein